MYPFVNPALIVGSFSSGSVGLPGTANNSGKPAKPRSPLGYVPVISHGDAWGGSPPISNNQPLYTNPLIPGLNLNPTPIPAIWF